LPGRSRRLAAAGHGPVFRLTGVTKPGGAVRQHQSTGPHGVTAPANSRNLVEPDQAGLLRSDYRRVHRCRATANAPLLSPLERRYGVGQAVKRRRGLRWEQRELVGKLRAEGASWGEVAAEFQRRYGLNARTALRLVHGWSQPDAANQWNERWPDDPKTLKNFSYWENWPAKTGREPSLRVLVRLAELYQCAVADLVSDVGDFRPLDQPPFRPVQLWFICRHGCGCMVPA